MKVTKICKYLQLINFRKCCETLKLWFNVLKNDWRFDVFFMGLAFVSLYVNLNYNNNSYYLKVDDVMPEQSDVSSSIVSMEELLEIEQILVQALNEHANKLQEKADEIHRGISTMRKQTEIYNIDSEDFVSQPIKSFPMLRRLKHEWKVWLKFLQEPLSTEFIEIIRKTLTHIVDFDLSPAAENVQQLCELYGAEPNNWIDGKLHLVEFDIPFNTLDCYAIAFLLSEQGKYQAANMWFEAALKSFKPRQIYNFMNGFSRTDIYVLYVENLLRQNRAALAFELITNAIKVEPTNSKLAALLSEIENFNMSGIKSSDELESKHTHKMKGVCRGDFIAQPTFSLFCYYNWSTNDFVRLTPFKVELMHENPIIMLYHDVLSGAELNDLKHLASEKMKSATIYANRNDSLESKSIFASKKFWIDGEYNDLLMLLNRRLEDMTGLSTSDSNVLMGNYGTGSCSVAHTDCSNLCENKTDENNCDGRLATVFIYLTDVKIGGTTIFPELNVGVQPQKGTALFWYNLQNDMNTCDNRTMHMACPVIVGSKWFLIKWINFKNQMFRKPCS